MKTSEFKDRLPSRYTVVSVNYGQQLKVVDCFYDEFAVISCLKQSGVFLSTNDINLIKLCLEYAETATEEREEEKRYIVILPDPRNDGEYRYALCKRHDGIGIGHVHRSGFSPLTEAEIKRNHEYLWQFAKEVQG